MNNTETEQIVLRLTKNNEVLNQLRINKMMKKDDEGEFLIIQFNSAAYTFRPGKTIVVGRTLGNALYRSSAIIIGDHLVGDIQPSIERLRSFDLGGYSEEFICPFCSTTTDAKGEAFDSASYGMHLARFCEVAAEKRKVDAAEAAQAEGLIKDSKVGRTNDPLKTSIKKR